MPGDVGAVATLLNTVASWLMDENGFAEFNKRRKLKAKKEEARRALIDNDFDALKRHIDELRDLSAKP